ncbi:MAG: GNAT family N-acetyltransferase [Anaerolineae bacterium]
MYIREAMPDDNDELQELQAKCPIGTTLIVSTINTPDFFARAKAYESYKVFVACEDNRIIGSAACAIRDAVVNGNTCRVGYEFQAFTSPDHRRKGVAKQLRQHIEDHLIQHGAVLSYLLIIEGNRPAMRVVEGQGFKLHRTLVMPTLLVHKQIDVPSEGKVRSIVSEDLVVVAELLNETWEGYDLYEPTSADALSQFVSRTAEYSFDNLLVLEDQSGIVACLGFWDWSRITRITVQAVKLDLKLRMMGLLLDIARNFRPMPRVPRPGDSLKQWVLTPIAFKDPGHLAVLLRYVNNLAIRSDIEQILCICEQDHELLSSMKGFFHADFLMHLYVKPLQQNILIGDKPIFIDGIDL